MLYFLVEFHVCNSNTSLVIPMEPKDTYRFYIISMLYVLQKHLPSSLKSTAIQNLEPFDD